MALVVFGVLAISALVFALLFVGSWGASGDASTVSPAQPDHAGPPPATSPQLAATTTPEIGTPAIETAVELDWREREKIFEGQARISGEIDAADGVVFPAQWRLVIEPSLFGVGRQHAATRILDMPGNQRSFEVADLPMGGYRVYAKAAGLNCSPQEVTLFKVEGYEHLPGRDHVHVQLRFARAGFMDGSVLDAEGQPAEGLSITMERSTTGERRSTETTPAGMFSFRDVVDGAHRIYFGDPNRPLIPAEDFVFKAPELRYPERAVPRLASVRFTIVDELARGIPGAKVRGWGPTPIDTETDAYGTALVRFLPAGRYKVRVDGSSSGLARDGKTDFLLEGGEVEKHVQVVCSQ